MRSEPGPVASVTGGLPRTGKAVSALRQAERRGEANLAGQIPVTVKTGYEEPPA